MSRQSVAAQRKGIVRATRYTLIEILRRGSIYDTDDPLIIEWACAEQEKIAKRIEKSLENLH